MKTITLALCLGALLAGAAQANPAIGPTISLGPAAGIQKPVPNDRRLEQPTTNQSRPLYAAPTGLQQKGTHPAIDSMSPVRRQRGSAGSLNLMLDMQARPAF